MFVILRLYGIRAAVLSGLVGMLLVPFDYINLSYRFIGIIEIIAIGCFFRNGRRAKMFFVDLYFWLTIGILMLFFISSMYLSGPAQYFNVIKNIVNGLFNVVIADMLLAYFPFYRFIKNNRINKNSVSIHQLLFHITVLSFLIPFFINIFSNTWNTSGMMRKDLELQADYGVSRLENELNLWNKADVHNLLLNNPTQMERLHSMIKRNKPQDFEIIIQSMADDVLASTSSKVSAKQLTNWQKTYDIKNISNYIFQAIPVAKKDVRPIQSWAEGKYIYIKNIESSSLKVMLVMPISHYQNQLFVNSIRQLKYLLFFASFTIILVMIVSRVLTKNLKQLTIVTTGLPQKLISLEAIEWPQSTISELRMLTRNLRKMANTLKELFKESIEMKNQLHRLAYYDVLTSLPNRLYFQNYVKELILNKPKEFIAIIFIDLNQFKQINDTLGHDVGDRLLKLTSKRLGVLQNNDREVFRLGGDEFVIVHSVDDKEEVCETIESILKEFSTFFQIQGQMLYITASIGVSIFPEDGGDLDTLVRYADIAMYISKEKGGNVAQFFDDSMRYKFQDNLLIENALRLVVENGCGFEQYYQPKTQFGEVTSMEALIRWHHPDLGHVSPSAFIPIAEDIGLILQIDEWSLNQACRQNKKWQDEGIIEVPISVNISAKHFQQDYLIPMIESALLESGMEAKYLKLEITESVFIKDPNRVAEVIRQIKSLGVLISIDDFGKGYSSLSQLLLLPIDEIKIDRQFIQDIDQNDKKALLVKSIFDIANGLKINVVSEGVETENERALLVGIGKGEIQGYLYSRPLSKEGMEEFLCVQTGV
ncbi:EAL domain-containing protein [Fredinandcohnia sp. SECRCQ15]|uniref:EAL domain-containing protein n=2 Tax=Fredinandcohnia quinoae TaxID=2918902 RepID=A0AAW5E3A1_9BACI|nr:EAL domain-containing protein [Fredinandcohnia sp. SECRCQ15]